MGFPVCTDSRLLQSRREDAALCFHNYAENNSSYIQNRGFHALYTSVCLSHYLWVSGLSHAFKLILFLFCAVNYSLQMAETASCKINELGGAREYSGSRSPYSRFPLQGRSVHLSIWAGLVKARQTVTQWGISCLNEVSLSPPLFLCVSVCGMSLKSLLNPSGLLW